VSASARDPIQLFDGHAIEAVLAVSDAASFEQALAVPVRKHRELSGSAES
jgi:hypothetical protein